MAFLTKQEFSERCGIQTKDLAVYIGRKKIKVKNDLIDTTISPNSAFLMKYSAKKAVKQSKSAPEERGKAIQTKVELDDSEFAELTLEKLKLQVEAERHKNQKLEQLNNKVAGNFIPVPQVEILIMHLSEAINLAWENEFEDSLNQIAIRHQLSREEITQLKKEKVRVSNASRERAIKEAKKSIRVLQAETSDKRGVGEHG